MKRTLVGFFIVAVGLVVSACGSDHEYLGSTTEGGMCVEYSAHGNVNEEAIPSAKAQLGLSDAHCGKEGVIGTCKIVNDFSGGSIETLKFMTGDTTTARAECTGEFTAF